MKHRTPAVHFPLLLVLPWLISCTPDRAPAARMAGEQTARIERKNAPNDQFWLIRSFPDTIMDIAAYEYALLEARRQDRQQRIMASAGFGAQWKLEGPVNIAGRINAIAMHPGDHDIIYAGNAAGGVFKTTDGGLHWTPVFDEHSHLAIGHLAIDPQDPDVLYAGTGDRNIPGYALIGDGLWKSADGGYTWQHLGLKEQRIISKVIVHPNDGQMLFVATMGLPSLRNDERGLYRTGDGGETWTQILFVAEDAGITDLIIDPVNPEILYAAAWNRFRDDRETVVTGTDARIYKTVDGGDTWVMLTGGLPEGPMCRIALAISATNPEKLYACYVDTTLQFGGVFRTEDGGNTWIRLADDGLPQNIMGGFGWYFGRIEVNPWNDDDLWVCAVDLWRTTDGGENWQRAAPPWWQYAVHADKHDLMFTGPESVVLATDGGMYLTTDNAETWSFISPLPNVQFYRLAVNPHMPGDYWGGTQDNGTLRGGLWGIDGWDRVFGGDGFQPVFHHTNPDVIYVQTQNGGIWVSEDGGFDFSQAISGIPVSDRRNWDMPLIMSHHDPDVLYAGTYRIYRNSCGSFVCWEDISPDLTDGVIYLPRFHTISALAESPVAFHYLWAGTSDGNVWHSTDAGANWHHVSDPLPKRYVTSIATSAIREGTAWVTHSGYRANDHFPHIHRTDDHGATWLSIAGNLPPLAINKVLPLPDDDDMLFAATDGGVYATLDGGHHWERLGSNMPYVPVFDLAYDPVHRRLIAGTHGRSMQSYPVDSLFVDTGVTHGTPAEHRVSLIVAPNPASDVTFVSLQGNIHTQGVLTLWDSSGRKAGSWQLSSGERLPVGLQKLAGGFYVFEWRDNGYRVVSKLYKN